MNTTAVTRWSTCICLSAALIGCGEQAPTEPVTPAHHASDAPPSVSPTTQQPASNESTITKTLNGPTVSPIDQGTGESDISLTLTIRKALAAESTLSVEAKNVTIVARDGNVTLRGNVPTASERDRVDTIARKLSGPKSMVDDQIDVTSSH